jgi:hemerythrin-like domain-containing protein
MTYMIEVLRQEHCNIESLLRVLEQELSVFERGDRPDYEVILAVISYLNDYPDSCHHPKENLIVDKLRVRDPLKAATIAISKPSTEREQSVCGASPSRSNAYWATRTFCARL